MAFNPSNPSSPSGPSNPSSPSGPNQSSNSPNNGLPVPNAPGTSIVVTPLATPIAPSAGGPSPVIPRPRPFRPGGGGGMGGGGGSRGGRYEAPTKDEHRINERIRVPQVRLIDENGGQVGIVPTQQALQMARDRGLDLMEVSPQAQPPVCKITDYGKFKYEKKKKEHVAKKKQTVIKVKEIQLRPQTEEHDLEHKFKNIRQFIEDGDKAKITIMFRGREIAYVEQGYKIMRSLVEKLKDIAVVEAPAKLEGKKLIMILQPSAQKKAGAAAATLGPVVKINPAGPVVGKKAESSSES